MEAKRKHQPTISEDRKGAEALDENPLSDLPKFILASASPRRAEILGNAGWPFETLAVNIDESIRESETAIHYVERLAREKAVAASRLRCGLVLGADTTVVVDEELLVKPEDAEDAARMLRLLSGRTHQVITGIALIASDTRHYATVSHEITEVRFARMSEAEIDWYVSTREPMDKAGAYAIQGLGARFITGISGDYLNVVGLPLRLLYRLVRERCL
jgi:septum formation protein